MRAGAEGQLQALSPSQVQSLRAAELRRIEPGRAEQRHHLFAGVVWQGTHRTVRWRA